MWQEIIVWVVVAVAVVVALVWGYKRLFCTSSCDDCAVRSVCNKVKQEQKNDNDTRNSC